MMKVIEKYLSPIIHDNIVPNDDTTLFICSGMQQFKSRFRNPDGSHYSSIQSCIRTNDLDLVGDGTHLTSFQMVGNFSFGGNDYSQSVDTWKHILSDLSIPIHEVHIHPSSDLHKHWLGYNIVDDPECVWSDGDIGGYCCEIYTNGLEIGNLVNPLGHSVDVGFGFERMLQILEGKNRVDETSLFDQTLSPVVRDHYRTLLLMKKNGIVPGPKGREFICKKLVRKVLGQPLPEISDWIEEEQRLKDRRMTIARKQWSKPKNKDKPISWWYDTLGVTPEELMEMQGV